MSSWLKVQTDPTGLLIQNLNISSPKDVPSNVANNALNDGLNLTNPEAENTSMMNNACTDEKDEQISKENLDSDQYDNAKKNAEIETVVESLLEALKEDEAPNTEQEKEKIITQYHHDDEIDELEINEWLTVDS